MNLDYSKNNKFSISDLLEGDFENNEKELLNFIDYLQKYNKKNKDNRIKVESCFISLLFNISSPKELHDYFKYLKEDFFSSIIFRFIFSCAKTMYSLNIPIDIVTFYQYIKEKEVDKNKGLVDLLNIEELLKIKNLYLDLNLSFYFNQYVLLLREFYLKDKVIKLSQDIIMDISERDKDIFSIIDYMRNFIDKVENDVIIEAEKSLVGDNVDEFWKNLTSVDNQKDRIFTNLHTLDTITGGFKKGELIVVAGRPGMGKSALVNRFFFFPPLVNNIPTLMISLEMTKEEVISRILSNVTGISVSKILNRKLSDDREKERIKEGLDYIRNAPMYIEDKFSLGLSELKIKIREYVQKKGVKMVIIDHIGLMDADTIIKKRSENRVQEIGEITRTLKLLAKELEIPIIAVSQLNREVEKRADKKPILSDLRDSGNIEQDANIVLFCYRPEYYLDANIKLSQNNKNSDDYSEDFKYYIGNFDFEPKGLFILNVAKNRHGATGDIALFYESELTRVINHKKIAFIKGLDKYPIDEPFMLDTKWKDIELFTNDDFENTEKINDTPINKDNYFIDDITKNDDFDDDF